MMIFGPKDDGTYVVEFRRAATSEALTPAPSHARVVVRPQAKHCSRGVRRLGIERRKTTSCADVFRSTEGKIVVVIARHEPAPRRRRPWHVQKPSAREPVDLHRCPHHGAVFDTCAAALLFAMCSLNGIVRNSK